jgi:hypothetical protein
MMSSRRRRLLIPGLLLALLVVVMLASALRRAEAGPTPLPVVPHQQVTVMKDPRITESSGLAASQAHPGIVYTVNDSGDESRVFAVDIESGRVVGVTTVANAAWKDAEAMALWRGKVVVADVGDNALNRSDQALYVFDELGAGEHRVNAERYPVDFGHKIDVEAMSIVPGRVDLFAKGWPNSYAFGLAIGQLKVGEPNRARYVGRTALSFATDATSSPDSRYVLVRGMVSVEVYDAASWKLVHTDVIPAETGGETIAMERSGRSYLIGREGSDSPLIRVAFNPAKFTGASQAPVDVATQLEAQQTWKERLQTTIWAHRNLVGVVAIGAVGLSGATLAWWWARRRKARRLSRDG